MFLWMLAAYVAGNVYVFIKGLAFARRIFAVTGAVYWAILAVVCVVFWFAVFSLPLSLFLRDTSVAAWLRGFMYNLGSVWMVFTLYMVMALLVTDFSRFFFPVMRVWGFPVSVAFVAVVLLCGYINYRNPRVEHITIDLSSEGGDSASCSEGDTSSSADKKLRIVAVSDIHLGYATGKKELQKFIGKINEQHPDVLLIGGDLIDNDVAPVNACRMWEELCRIEAPGGIFMVPGNHEYISGIGKVEEFLKQTPVVLVRDSVVRLPGGAVLVGRDDRSNRGRKEMEELVEMSRVASAESRGDVATGVPAEADGGRRAPVILLEHQPYSIAMKDSLGIDLQFYGHTHRGQVWPMSLLVDRMYEQSHGYRKWEHSHVVVSCGLSLWGPPFRIGTNSDMWVIDLIW